MYLVSKFKQCLAISVLVFTGVTQANAAVTYTVENGNLMSAQGIDVGGALYNVEFLDGKFEDLFTVSELRPHAIGAGYYVFPEPFETYEDIQPFGQALLDQVFVDTAAYAWDSVPSLVNGCSHPTTCEMIIPFMVSSLPDGGTNGVHVYNSATDTTNVSFQTQVGDFIVLSGVDTDYPTDQFSHRTFAKFSQQSVSPVPEAPNFVLLAVGSLMLLGMGRRRRNHGKA